MTFPVIFNEITNEIINTWLEDELDDNKIIDIWLEDETDDEETMYKVIEHLTTPFPKWDKVSGISKEIKQFLALF